jgi:carbonic anhydrase/acetyltransferase-like protein (isoleucine patch superfamily)
VLPFVGIAAKWLIVGQYRQGRYPVWGAMYLRWWLVDQILEICGRGVMVNYLPTYYRLLGARVGRHVKISAQATVKEFDLLTIGADAALDACLVRAFCVDRGTMLLLPVTVGAGCCVGPKSSVAPGTSLAPGTCLGPLTSSHEAGRDAHARHRKSCRPLFPGGPAGFAWRYWLVGKPCLGLVRGVGALPWLLVLWYAVTAVKTASGVSFVSTFQEAVAWFTLPQRVVLYCLLRAVQATLKPPLELAVAIALKRCVVGTLPAGPRPTHGSAAFNVWLANQLVGGGSLRGVTPLVGTHYEFVSCVYRLLGAKVGKRVYWPGSGLELAGLFDLLEVGDDVTFGSRSLVLAGDADTLATVAIGAGAMVADRCVLLPGTDVGRLATLGSGCLTRPRQRVPAGATVVGSRRGTCVELQGHDPDADKDTTPTVAPFGRAFYQGRAKGYRVRGQLEVALLGFSAHSTGAAFHALPLPAALAATVALDRYAFGGALIGAPWQFMLLLWPLYGVCFGGMVLSCLALDVACKWALLGRRTAGPHPWDTDPYCQNWQAYLTLASALRGSVGGGRGALDFVRGSALLNAYFRCLGATIESRVLLYPTGGDPMMTEPDLVTLERGACVDEASLVCHVNSRGAFALHPLVVGEGATLRSQSRLLSGAAMEPWSSLQEHTLVLGGDVVPEGVTWQGWPANQDDSSLLSRATLAAADGAPSAAAGRRSTAHQHGHEHRHGVRGSLAAVNRGGSSQGYRASQGQARLSTFNERFTVARPSGAAGRYSTATMAQLIRDSVV